MISGLRSLSILLGLILSHVTVAAEQRPPDLDRVLQALASEAGFERTYTEQRESPLLSEPIRVHGRIVFRPPDYFRKTAEGADRGELVVDGDHVTLRDAGEVREGPLDEFRGLHVMMRALRSLVAGDREALERQFQVSVDGSWSDWELRLTPREVLVSASRLSGDDRWEFEDEVDPVRLQGARQRLERIVTSTGGGRVVLRLDGADR